jgi:hypothetical protein
LNTGQDINELEDTTAENTSVIEQQIKMNNLFINPCKTLHSLSYKTMQTGK